MARRLFRLALLACVLAAMLPISTGSAQDTKLAVPSAEDFGALPFMTRPLLSPDGRHIAAQGLAQGRTAMLLIDISTPERKVRAVGLPPGLQIEWIRWAGSQRIIVSVSRMDRLFEEEVRLTRLVQFDLDTLKQRFLGPKQQGVDGDDIVFIDPEGAFLLLSTQPTIYEFPAVYRVDLSTGASTRSVASQDGIWSWYADASGVVRAGMGIDDARWWLIYREKDGDSFKRTLRVKAARGETSPISEFVPVPGSDQGYAVADGRNGRLALFRYDFKADQLGELVFEHPSVDIDTFDLDRTGALSAIFYTNDHSEVIWHDPILERQQQRIDAALPNNVNLIASVSRDRNRMLIWTGSGTHPGAYLLFDRKANAMEPLAEPYEALTDKQLSPMEPVRYKARDGLEIRGYLTLPPGRDRKGLPLIVMPHGGPYARDEWGYDPWVQYLASRGYAVLQPNFRGSTGFGRAFVESGTGQWGRGMQNDLDDGVKWLADRGTVDSKRVCIMGGSYGGYAAQWGAIRNPEIYRCAISFAGVSDVSAQLKYSRSSFAAPRYFSDWRKRVMGSKDFDLDQISPLRQAARITIPILIAHGTEDDRVPISQSRRLHAALLQQGRPHDYIEYKGEGHGFESPVNATDFLVRVGTFLDKHNPP